MERLIERAQILVEALPYIRRFAGKTIVIKYGGAAMDREDLTGPFAEDVLLLQQVGIRPVVVHGGGPQITRWLDRVGIQSEFVDGVRVTSPEAMEVVEMVLVGQVNRAIVSRIEEHGGKAVGLTGKDGGLVRARRAAARPTAAGPRDLGCVGEVVGVDPQVIDTLESRGFVPVIATVARGEHGESLNLNADTFAGEVAAALKAEKLILLTDVEGVRAADGTRLSRLTKAEVRRLIDDGTIRGGMIPKVECCLHALAGGARHAHILDGRVKHAILLELFTNEGVGTLLERGAG